MTTEALFDEYVMHEDVIPRAKTRDTFYQNAEVSVPLVERECIRPHHTIEPLSGFTKQHELRKAWT